MHFGAWPPVGRAHSANSTRQGTRWRCAQIFSSLHTPTAKQPSTKPAGSSEGYYRAVKTLEAPVLNMYMSNMNNKAVRLAVRPQPASRVD